MVREIGNLFHARNVPWEGLGTGVEMAPDSAAALKTAGLDWKVQKRPVRVSCSNMLNLACQQAMRSWAVRHVGNMEEKMREAANTLKKARIYLDGLQLLAERLAKVRIPKR